MQPAIDTFIKIVPFLAALGIFHIGAAAIRAGWAKVQIAAGKTPSKVDDFLVHIMDPVVAEVANLVDAGDVEGAKRKIAALRSMVPK